MLYKKNNYIYYEKLDNIIVSDDLNATNFQNFKSDHIINI